MPFDTSVASNVMKNFYLPTMQKLLNSSTVLMSRLRKDSSTQTVDGKNFTVAIHNSQNDLAGIGKAENASLPTDGNQGYLNAIVPNKYVYTSIRLSGPVMRATKTNEGAWVRALQSEIEGALTDMQRRFNLLLHGDGTYALAYLTGTDTDFTGSGSGVDLDDNQGNPFVHLLAGQQNRVDVLDISDYTTILNSAALSLGYTSETTTTVRYTAPAGATGGTISTTADGDIIIPRGATPGYQMMGLEGVVSASNPPNVGGLLANGLHGLPVASNPNWKAQILGSESSKRDISFADMQRVLSMIAKNSAKSEADVKFLLCSYETRDRYVELCTNERGWFNTMTIDGGFDAVEYNNKPLVPDNQCRRGRIYFIVPESLAIFRTADFEWMGEDGSQLSRVSGVDAYDATLFHYGDLACLARNCNGALIGLND